MAIKKYKPVTPGQRNKAISSFDEITAKKPYKKLLAPIKSTGGRNNTGQMTVRYRGGGHSTALWTLSATVTNSRQPYSPSSTIPTAAHVSPSSSMRMV